MLFGSLGTKIALIFSAIIGSVFPTVHAPLNYTASTASPTIVITATQTPAAIIPEPKKETKTQKPVVTTATVTPKPKVVNPVVTPKPRVDTEVTPTPTPTPSPVASLPLTLPPNVDISTTTQVSLTDLNEKTRAALVNVFCTTKSGGSFQPITGSGVLIDKRGVILTNAHVAQYFLLKDYIVKDFVDCVIRTGNPATPKYTAELLYISPQWISDNRSNIIEQNPLGTGEHDFALLHITGVTGPSVVKPAEFPYLEPATYDSDVANDTISDTYITAGYPAGFLGGIAVQRDLYSASTVSTVVQEYTFHQGTTLDLIALGGSILAQKGASGGAVVNQRNGKLVGLIVTTTSAAETANRNLHAETTSHINRSLTQSLSISLPEYLNGDLNFKAAIFNRDVAPSLREMLSSQINKTN